MQCKSLVVGNATMVEEFGRLQVGLNCDFSHRMSGRTSGNKIVNNDVA